MTARGCGSRSACLVAADRIGARPPSPGGSPSGSCAGADHAPAGDRPAGRAAGLTARAAARRRRDRATPLRRRWRPTLDQIAAEMDAMESPVTLGADDGQLARRRAARGRSRAGPRQPMSHAGRSSGSSARCSSRCAGCGGQLGDGEASDRVRLWRGVLELVAASLAGIVDDDVLWRGFGVLDEEDLRGVARPPRGERGDADALAGAARPVRPDVRIPRRRQATAEPRGRAGACSRCC